jgi:hypothetical protein
MSLVRVVLLGFAAVLASAAMSSSADAACACSRVGQSNGYYAAPSAYGYGANYGTQQTQARPVQSKAGKSKKKALKNKPVSQ